MPQSETIPLLIRKCSTLLKAMFDDSHCLFAYSTRLQSGKYVNDFFPRAGVYRYTINSLLGIQRAKAFYDLDWDVDEAIRCFVSRYRANVTNAGDNGLLLYLLAEAGYEAASAQLSKIERICQNANSVLALNVQEICWMLAGVSKYAATSGSTQAIALAVELWGVVSASYFNAKTCLPLHNLSGHRRGLTSFGGVAYFLWAASEYARVSADSDAQNTFQAAVRAVIRLQGPRGEWPWFINAIDATVLDWYQLYTVHQDSMSMLFLLAALDAGMSEAKPAIEKSYRWLFGKNELGVRMVSSEPFLIHRSIRQNTKFERQRRYLRALGSRAFDRHARELPSESLAINSECRSYHIGWLLFVWAGRTGFEEFTELELLPDATIQWSAA